MRKPKKVIAASKTHSGKNLGLKHLGKISNLKPARALGVKKSGKTPSTPRATHKLAKSGKTPSAPKSTHLKLKGLTYDV